MNSKIAWSMIVYSIGFILLADSYQIIPNSYYFERAKTDLLNLIESVRVGRDLPMIAGIVRLAFHDCIGKGKCNGCLDHSLPNNRGLKKVTDRLDMLYDASYKGKMSRADFYALSAVIALTRSTSSVRNKYNGIKTFKVGRKDCNTSPVELQSNSEFPRGSDGTSKTLGFFKQEFGFNTREAVAILGAHTLGRCKTQNSGFVGAWVDSRFSTALPGEALAPTSILDNAYYRMIVDVVQWDQVNINGTRIQWQEQNRPIPNDKLQESRRSPLLLNSDMSISWIITPTENIGTVSCTPTSQSNPCLHSNAHTYAKLYAHNNAFWVQEFTRVFNKMISRSDYKLRKSPTPITNTFYIQKPLYNDEEMFDGIDEDEF